MSLTNLTNQLRERIQKLPDGPPPSPKGLDHRRVSRMGYAIILGTFGLLGLWAAFAPLDSAVIAPGLVSVESSRKTLQHLEGGIVRAIHVTEGQRVQAGQVLYELDPTQARASYDIMRTQTVRLQAQEARLLAERDNLPAPSYPADLMRQTADPLVSSTLADESRIFTERRSALQGQISILTARLDQYRSEINGIDQEIASLREQSAYLQEEIAGLKELYERELVPKPRLLAIQRERAGVQGRIGRLIADRAKAQKAIGEANLQMSQIKRQFYEEASGDLADVRTKLGESQERFVVAQDTVRRIRIVAPVSGVAQSVRVSTVGAVIRPGEPIVDIAPDREELVIHAQFSPTDVDNVHAGMKTEVRFPSFHSRRLPLINGTIQSISGDRLVDEATKAPYFLGVIHVAQQELPDELHGKLQAGLPAEVIVPTGERTVLEYIFQPLTNALRLSGREE
ncbi:HlyD family type I secretion periplasmic adaptor subunit [Phenylobacterium sp.]|jgi:HlyD family secretion protein/S-layer protein transport system membrane fusion protein|uniref:HlyD family type I secretion periplasmic adaptor subunit n=1 Tax=Phenylobacterium sp. TaxID=1871053 RepID=UPI002F91FBD5